MVQQIDPGSPSYEQLLSHRHSQGQSTSRKSFYWDTILALPEQQRFQLFRLFIDELDPNAKEEVDDIDHAIDAHQYNRATTLSYTCLEGLYKTYVRKHVPEQVAVTDLMPLCKLVKDDISKKLQAQGPFPMEIVNAMPTLTKAIANSRNGFSESHFGDESQRWLALFARDLTNSVGRLMLNFI
jgi:hypothetical protein